MPVRLIDDAYDVLEGTLDEVIRIRDLAADRIEHLILGARVREARCAVALLSALMRDGHRWRPAEDGYEATEWRETLLAVHDADYQASYRELVVRELDELVALAKPGQRRALPAVGTFERLARAAGLSRGACRTWAREAKIDQLRGWNSCEDPRSLVRIPLALGLELEHVFRALCLTLLDAVPTSSPQYRELLATAAEGECAQLDAERMQSLRSAARDDFEYAASFLLMSATTGSLNPMRVEHMFDSAARVVEATAVRKRIQTPAMTERLSSRGVD